MQRPAPGALGDLRALVLADHPLKLAQQLVLRRAGALRLLRKDHLHTRARELLQQQHLVGVATREAIGRMAQQHLERSLRRTIAQPLKRRADQRRAREPVILKNEVVAHQQLTPASKVTQRGELTLNRLGLTLALGGHPRVDRRHPRRPPAAALVAAHRSTPVQVAHQHQHDAPAPAPTTRTPARREPPPAGRRRTRRQRGAPPRPLLSPRPSERSSPTRSACAVVSLKLTPPRAAAAARTAAINDPGNRTVNTSVRSGTTTPSGQRSAARTYRRA